MRAPGTALLVALVAAPAALGACDAASSDPGTRSLLIIPGAQFVSGSLPPDQGGPRVVAVNNDFSVINPGSTGNRVQGALERAATGVAVGVPGDRGYWVQTAQIPDVVSPDLPSFEVRASYADRFPYGPFDVVIQAVDSAGRFGPKHMVALDARPTPPPSGELVFTLSWSHDADLDLHVVTPNGIEVWRENINSYVPPPAGQPEPDPTAPSRGGLLDFDSNSNCVIDGRRQENVIWTVPAPPGRYLVRVDTVSMCGRGFAYWEAEALQRGVSLGRARGIARPTDTRAPHGPGAGATAIEVVVP